MAEVEINLLRTLDIGLRFCRFSSAIGVEKASPPLENNPRYANVYT